MRFCNNQEEGFYNEKLWGGFGLGFCFGGEGCFLRLVSIIFSLIFQALHFFKWGNEAKEGEERVKQALARKYYSEEVKKNPLPQTLS